MTHQEWERWWAEAGLQSRLDEAFRKHLSSPETTFDEHLAKRRVDLNHELEGKKLVYMDTKHWVNLCHVVLKTRHATPLYTEVFGLLKLLRQKSRICCPVSATLFEELMRQTDKSTRQATAQVMDSLGGGACLQNWLDLAKAEFGRHICQLFQIEKDQEMFFPIWTKVGYRQGESSFEFLENTAEKSVALEKAFFDVEWDMSLEQAQSMPGWIPTPDSFSAAWVQEARRAKHHQAQSPRNFKQLVQDRRRQLLSAFKSTLLPLLALCRGIPGSPKEQVAAVFDPIYQGKNPNAMPSLEVVAALDAAITLDTRRGVQANDLEDYIHAAQALPHSDALFCDNFMAQQLRTKPLEFGMVYRIEIGSRPEEILGYLKTLD